MSRDNKNNKILYIILGIVVLVIIGVIVLLMINKKNSSVTDNSNNDNDKNKNEIENKTSNIGYVSCKDNSSLLNVRNSSTGNIIDGISCYQRVNIEDTLDKTDNCDKWYKINYDKHGSNYTGFVCSSYIDLIDDDKDYDGIKDSLDKAFDYFDSSSVLPYCGKYTDSRVIDFNTDGNTFTGNYVKSEYKNIDELTKYVTTFIDKSLMRNYSVGDYSNPEIYDDYYMIDGDLYCRNYSGKGYMTLYTGNYNFEISSVSDNKFDINIAYEYFTNDVYESFNGDNSKCNPYNLSACSNSDFEYKIGKASIEKRDGNYVITRIDLHD